jgi:hypothetical protein
MAVSPPIAADEDELPVIKPESAKGLVDILDWDKKKY